MESCGTVCIMIHSTNWKVFKDKKKGHKPRSIPQAGFELSGPRSVRIRICTDPIHMCIVSDRAWNQQMISNLQHVPCNLHVLYLKFSLCLNKHHPKKTHGGT
jgi:hypothetical protein